MNIRIFLGRVFSFRNAKTAALVLGGIAVFLFAVSYGFSWYAQWKGRQGVENLAETLKKIEAEDYKLAIADTYGGKTPQETLQMYIDAVEKGDYELASKYFIKDKQKQELERLNSTKNNSNDLRIFLDFLKKSEPWRSSLDNDNFTMEAKTNLGPSIFIRFIKYPSNIWKIIEI